MQTYRSLQRCCYRIFACGLTGDYRRDQVLHTLHLHARFGLLILDGDRAFLLLETVRAARIPHRRQSGPVATELSWNLHVFGFRIRLCPRNCRGTVSPRMSLLHFLE